MRRRLLGDSSIPDVYATFVQHMDAQPGDVVFYNTKTNGRSYYRLDEGDDLIPKTCVPIGIIAIPVGNEYYSSSDICSAISLCHMSSKDVQGDITPEEIMWGDDTVDVNANWQIIDGKITTKMILDIRGDIGGDIDFDNPSHYPAASSCNAYYTVGTKPGDWYLPSYYELVYGIPSNIDEVLSKLRDIYGEYKIMEYLPLDLYGWTSNDYGAKFAFATWMLNQEYFGKTARCYVVAFTQLSSNLERNYGDILISGGNTTDIPASGGSSQVTGYTYSQTYGYGDSTTNGGIITGNADISVTSVSGDNLGTTETERTKKGESVLTVTMNGKTATKSWDVYLEANVKIVSTTGGTYSYGDVTAGSISNGWIGAGGGTGTGYAGNGSQYWSKSATINTETWTSGAIKETTIEDASDGYQTITPSRSSYSISAGSKGTTVSDVTTWSASVYWYGSGGKTASGTIYVQQAANSSWHSHLEWFFDSSEFEIEKADVGAYDYIHIDSGSKYHYVHFREITAYSSGSTSSGTAKSTRAYVTNVVGYNGPDYGMTEGSIVQDGYYDGWTFQWKDNKTGAMRSVTLTVYYYSNSYSDATSPLPLTLYQNG